MVKPRKAKIYKTKQQSRCGGSTVRKKKMRALGQMRNRPLPDEVRADDSDVRADDSDEEAAEEGGGAPPVNESADAPLSPEQHDATPSAAPPASQEPSSGPATSSHISSAPSAVAIDHSVPSTSQHHSRGYHPPKSPRRSARTASLQAAKTKTPLSPDEVISSPEELPIPPDEEEVLQGVAQALASSWRPLRPRRVSVLLDEAQDFLPVNDHRSRRPTISPLEASLLSDVAVPASKITYRLGRDIPLDYGEHHTGEFYAGNYNISKPLAEELMQSRHRCRTCQRLLKYQVVGYGAATTFTAICKNERCTFDKISKTDLDKIGKYYSKLNLTQVFQTLYLDTGFVGFPRD